MKLTKAERRILEQAVKGPSFVQVGTGNNGATRSVVHRLNVKGLMTGHVITPTGRSILDGGREK